MSVPEEDDFRIQPPEGPSREEILRELEPPPVYQPPPPAPPQRVQFSVRDIMVVTGAVSLGLAGGTWMPVDIFAAVMGLLMLGGLIAAHLYPPESRWAKLLWWSLGIAYTVAVLAAVLKPAGK